MRFKNRRIEIDPITYQVCVYVMDDRNQWHKIYKKIITPDWSCGLAWHNLVSKHVREDIELRIMGPITNEELEYILYGI